MWGGPAIFMMQNIMPVGMQASGFGIYFCGNALQYLSTLFRDNDNSLVPHSLFSVVILIGGGGPELYSLSTVLFPGAESSIMSILLLASYLLWYSPPSHRLPWKLHVLISLSLSFSL